MMATAEERAHAIRLLEIHRGNLERLEEKKAKFGIDAPQWIENQLNEERANIAALEPIANPPPLPSQKVQEFVKQTTPGEIDLMMLYLQGTQINARMTTQETQTTRIIEEQSHASIDRMQTKDAIETLVGQTTATERARQHGAKWYRRGLLIAIGLALLALIIGSIALQIATGAL